MEFDKKTPKPNSILLTIVIAIIGGLAYGFLRTLFNTFFDLIHANHEYAQDAALAFFIVIYIISKVCVNRKREKDDIAHLLYKRVFHIFELLLFSALILNVIWLVLKYTGLLRI